MVLERERDRLWKKAPQSLDTKMLGYKNMEIALIIIGIIIIFGLIGEVIERLRTVNWARFFGVLLVGGALLAVIFSFTAEGVLVIVGAYVLLVIISLMFGVFSKKTVNETQQQGIEKGRNEVAKNLLDILDDETIADKTNLSIEDVKALRKSN